MPGGHSKEPSRSVEVETTAPLASLAWPGTNVVISITKDGTSKSVDAGEVVGTLNATSAGGPRFRSPSSPWRRCTSSDEAVPGSIPPGPIQVPFGP